jgi:transcriptional regulator with XRE-family HTH domain
MYAQLGHHEGMARDWKRLGEAIKSARRSLGGITQQDLADAAGVSKSTIQALEAGRVGDNPPPSLAHIERVFGWPRGTGTEVADGAAAPAPDGLHVQLPAPTSGTDWADQLPRLVREELQGNAILDADVIDVGRDGAPLKLVVLAISEKSTSLTPEELKAAQEQWQRSRRKLWTVKDETAS